MKGLLFIILLVATLVYSVFTFIPQGEGSNARPQSITTTVMHIDNKLARNLE